MLEAGSLILCDSYTPHAWLAGIWRKLVLNRPYPSSNHGATKAFRSNPVRADYDGGKDEGR